MKDVKIDFYDLGLTEIVVMPTSNFAGLRIGDANLRKRFGINVLGVKRGGSSSSSSEGGRGGNEYITDNLIATKLHVGDMLLVQGEWTNLAHLTADTSNWVVLDQPEKLPIRFCLDYKAPVAAAIMLLMIAMMVFDFIPVAPVTAVIIAGLLTVFAGCFRNVEAAYKTINWESIVLIAAMMPMSTALEKTGASALVSQGLVDSLGAMGPNGSAGGHLLHHFADDDVYQQYRHGGSDGAYCPGGSPAGGGESILLPLCGNPGSQHVLRLSVLYSA